MPWAANALIKRSATQTYNGLCGVAAGFRVCILNCLPGVCSQAIDKDKQTKHVFSFEVYNNVVINKVPSQARLYFVSSLSLSLSLSLFIFLCVICLYLVLSVSSLSEFSFPLSVSVCLSVCLCLLVSTSPHLGFLHTLIKLISCLAGDSRAV